MTELNEFYTKTTDTQTVEQESNDILGINVTFEQQEDKTYLCRVESSQDDNVLLRSFLCCLDQIKENNPNVFHTIKKVIFNEAIKDCEEYRKQFEEQVKKDIEIQKQLPSTGLVH